MLGERALHAVLDRTAQVHQFAVEEVAGVRHLHQLRRLRQGGDPVEHGAGVHYLVGLALVIGIQAFIIAAGNLKVLPLTGVTLPFISYGGSSIVANSIVVGLLLALSDKGVEAPPPPTPPSRWQRLRRRGGA